MKWLRRVAEALLALLILFEEWGWEPLQQAMARMARLPVLGAIERWVGSLSPGPALATFLVPSLLLVPVKLAALWFIGEGQPMMGLAVLVLAKLVGTAVVAVGGVRKTLATRSRERGRRLRSANSYSLRRRPRSRLKLRSFRLRRADLL